MALHAEYPATRPAGSGKTHLAAKIIELVVRNGGMRGLCDSDGSPARYAAFLQRSINVSSGIVLGSRACVAHRVDDIDAAVETKGNATLLNDVIDTAYDSNCSTVITTTMALPELAETIAKKCTVRIALQVARRLQEMTNGVSISLRR